MNKAKPIGVFDSGVGGLSVCHAIKDLLPREDIIYFADNGFSPYGNKPTDVIDSRCESIAGFLMNKGCKALVVACNTATAHSIGCLRSKFSVPIIGIEPGIKPASLNSCSGVIAVLATQQTLSSESFRALKERFSEDVTIEVQACPEFVELVERVDLASDQAIEVVKKYIDPVLSKGCDHIILGCTHFSFLKSLIEFISAGRAAIIDTAIPVAEELKRRLHDLGCYQDSDGAGKVEFWTSGVSTSLKNRVSQLWGEEGIVYEVQSEAAMETAYR